MNMGYSFIYLAMFCYLVVFGFVCFVFEKRSHFVAQDGLELLGSNNSPGSTSWVTGSMSIGMHYYTWLSNAFSFHWTSLMLPCWNFFLGSFFFDDMLVNGIFLLVCSLSMVAVDISQIPFLFLCSDCLLSGLEFVLL